MEYSPFYGIEKGAVLQEARVFNDPQLDPRRCSQVYFSVLPFYQILYFVLVSFGSNFFSNHLNLVLWSVVCLLFQVITKLLYLLNQGETLTKVNFKS